MKTISIPIFQVAVSIETRRNDLPKSRSALRKSAIRYVFNTIAVFICFLFPLLCHGSPSLSIQVTEESKSSDPGKEIIKKSDQPNQDQLIQDKNHIDAETKNDRKTTSPDGSSPVQNPANKKLHNHILRQNDRQAMSFRIGIVLVGIFLLIVLLKISLHVNHITHGNYAGRLQFWGVGGGLLILGSCGLLLNQVDPPEISSLRMYRKLANSRQTIPMVPAPTPESESDLANDLSEKSSSESAPLADTDQNDTEEMKAKKAEQKMENKEKDD